MDKNKYYQCSCITSSVLKLVAAYNFEVRYSLFFNIEERRFLYLLTFLENLLAQTLRKKHSRKS